VLPHVGDLRLEDLTPDRVERWAANEIDPDRRMANRTREKTITVFHGVMERARKLHRLPANPVADVEKPRTATRTEIRVFSPEEVMALVRAAHDSQDEAIYLTAAFTGLRQGELVALRWRDVDFAGSAIRVRMSYTNGHLTSPKSGKVRSVPTPAAPFPRPPSHVRHTIIGVADIRRVPEWMGHANVQTTMQYLHYVPRPQDAALVGEAFDLASNGRRGPRPRDESDEDQWRLF
jgi:integrase